MGTVSGVVRDSTGAAVAGRTVRAYRRDTGVLLGQATTSDGNPAPGDDDYANRLLILNMNGANNSTTFTDSSAANRTVTSNDGAKITTSKAKFGTASGDFSVSSESLSVASNAAFAFGTGDFTVETFIWFNGTTNNAAIFDLGAANSAGGLAWFFSGTDMLVRIGGLGNDLSCGGLTSEYLDTWIHLALVRSSGVLTVYRNGAVMASATRAQDITQNSPYIGQLGGFGFYFNGWMDSFRVSNIAEYTAAFTPPSIEFPDGAPGAPTPVGSYEIDCGAYSGDVQVVALAANNTRNSLILDWVTPV